MLRMPHMPDTPRLSRIASIVALCMIRERPRAGDPPHPSPDARRPDPIQAQNGRTLKTNNYGRSVVPTNVNALNPTSSTPFPHNSAVHHFPCT